MTTDNKTLAVDGMAAQPAAAQEAVVTYCGRRLTPEGTRECWGFLSDGVEDLPRGTKLYAAPVAAAPVEMSPEFTDTARAAIAWVLWHHQGGSSPVGQPLRFALGMGQHDRMTDQQIAEAKRFAAWANATTEDFHQRAPAQAVDLDAVRALLQRRIEQWRPHLPADPGAPGTREIETKGEHDYNNDVRIYREGIAVMEEVLSKIDGQAVGNG